jgi:peptidoglycan hydrolase-like protein with peptidoglycan-binding domain
MICRNRELAYTELSYVIAYQALREASTPAERKVMVDNADGLVIAINDRCNIAKTGALQGPPSNADVQCIKGHFERQHGALISRTSGPARDEATLDPAETMAIQRGLQSKSYQPATADVDGVFGPVTRQAISSWRKDNRLRETGFGSKAMLAALSALPQAGNVSVAPPSERPTVPARPQPQIDRAGKTSSIRLALAEGPDLRAQDLFEQVSAAVYVVKAGEALGSAVAISDRELLTNCHVVRTSRTVSLEREGIQLTAGLASANTDADRCVLRIGEGSSTLPRWVRVRAYADLKVGERVFTIGAPRGL